MSKNMQYFPKLTDKEVKENHKRFVESTALYKKEGIDVIKIRKSIIARIAKFLQGNILEIGTGTGYATLVLAKMGYRFISIDKDREVLKTAALNLAYEGVLSNVKFYTMDAKSLNFINSSFNNIVIVNLFHHINDINEVLSEVDRILCANGRLILTDFNKRGMKIVNSVHKSKGHRHEDSGASEDYIYSYFSSLRYEIKKYKDEYHWILVARKRIER